VSEVSSTGPSTDPAFAVRRMIRGEVDLALEWAAAEGWNPGKHDAHCFYAADPDGFFIGEYNGEPVACLSAVAYDHSFGFIGLYIVKPEFRGKGFGIQLWNTGMAFLDNRNVGLDGVVTQQANYKKSGFRLAYRNIRYRGTGGGTALPGVVELSEVLWPQLVAYDRQFFPAPRPQFLRQWIAQPGGAALGVVNDGQLCGYGVLRACQSGYKIGPLFADHEQMAENLFRALSANVPGQAIFLDVPEVNPSAVALAERHSMQSVFETARMYTKEPPAVRIDGIYGVTTLELG